MPNPQQRWCNGGGGKEHHCVDEVLCEGPDSVPSTRVEAAVSCPPRTHARHIGQRGWSEIDGYSARRHQGISFPYSPFFCSGPHMRQIYRRIICAPRKDCGQPPHIFGVHLLSCNKSNLWSRSNMLPSLPDHIARAAGLGTRTEIRSEGNVRPADLLLFDWHDCRLFTAYQHRKLGIMHNGCEVAKLAKASTSAPVRRTTSSQLASTGVMTKIRRGSKCSIANK